MVINMDPEENEPGPSDPEENEPGPSDPEENEPGPRDPEKNEPGPSGTQSPAPAFKVSSSKGIRWDSKVDEDEKRSTEASVKNKARRQSLVGTSGYVSQLLDQHLEDDSVRIHEDPEWKPIRKQSLEERRASIRAVETDTGFYMKEATFPKAVKSTSKLKLTASLSSSKSKVGILAKPEDLPESLIDGERPTSEWRPSHLLEEEKTGIRQERSWVGSYTVGKDYWNSGTNGEENSKKIAFSLDDGRKPWYDMPLQGRMFADSKMEYEKARTLEKIEALKDEMDEEYEQKRKERMISAAQARQEPTVVEKWTEEFKQCFHDMSRAKSFSRGGPHISMTDADRWLEKAGILDHAKLTLIHTGFCFLANGGSRHQGLAFTEFTHFLQMISFARGIPLRDVVRRLTACQRNPEDFTVML